jgi:hypothetical protein
MESFSLNTDKEQQTPSFKNQQKTLLNDKNQVELENAKLPL